MGMELELELSKKRWRIGFGDGERGGDVRASRLATHGMIAFANGESRFAVLTFIKLKPL